MVGGAAGGDGVERMPFLQGSDWSAVALAYATWHCTHSGAASAVWSRRGRPVERRSGEMLRGGQCLQPSL